MPPLPSLGVSPRGEPNQDGTYGSCVFLPAKPGRPMPLSRQQRQGEDPLRCFGPLLSLPVFGSKPGLRPARSSSVTNRSNCPRGSR